MQNRQLNISLYLCTILPFVPALESWWNLWDIFTRHFLRENVKSSPLRPQANFSCLISITVPIKTISHTLCKQLEVSDFFSNLQLKDLLQNVLAQAFLGNAHSFKLFVSESQQSTTWMQKAKRKLTQGFPSTQIFSLWQGNLLQKKNSQPWNTLVWEAVVSSVRCFWLLEISVPLLPFLFHFLYCIGALSDI